MISAGSAPWRLSHSSSSVQRIRCFAGVHMRSVLFGNRSVSSLRTRVAALLVFCVLPLLGGCIPGSLWGSDDDASRSSFSENSQDRPALNRSYKSSLMSLKMPTFSVFGGEAQVTPDSGPSSSLSGSSTVESRKPSPLNTPGIAANSPAATPCDAGSSEFLRRVVSLECREAVPTDQRRPSRRRSDRR